MLATVSTHEVHASLFLRVAQSGAVLASGEDLRRWLAGEVQALLPHDAVLAVSGDFRQGPMHVELAAGLPAGSAHAPGLARVLQTLRDCWVAARHAPCPVDLAACAGPPLLPGLRHALVHGTRDPLPAGERLVAFLHTRPAAADAEARALALRLLVPFIDAALRRLSLAPLPFVPLPAKRPGPPERGCGAGSAVLSERERQIMSWVAMGKTNPEIGCILCISEFTVKNHLKSIFTKLDVTNRAQAVAKLTRLTVHA
jgi:transcriptional regulator EpsA